QEKQAQLNALLDQLNTAIEQRREQVEELETQIAELETEREVATLNDTQQAIIQYVNSLPNGAETLQQIADNVERSKSTVSKYVNELVQLGVFSWNGTIKAKVDDE
ncbi:winged helix-turn-helix transcriptional regulator, partial [Candidatus Kaiserbacteria bacterium]|nr:winged helix-turn-helix transcriptional regulator [Candidatus Kaiserbacteria bacterium]